MILRWWVRIVFRIHMSIYVPLTIGNEHFIVPVEMPDHADIFHKYYARAHEHACRSSPAYAFPMLHCVL